MKTIIDIPMEDFEKLKEEAMKSYQDMIGVDKEKGYRFELDIDIDGVEIDSDDVTIYGGSKKNSVWVNFEWTPDADDMKGLVELTVRKLNRFKSALESITSINK